MSKFFNFLIFISSMLFTSSLIQNQDLKLVNKFKLWLNTFNIKVLNDNHLDHLFDNWLSNDKFIELTNSQNLTYTLGHNHFSGMNSTEFNNFMNFNTNNKLLFQETSFLRGSGIIVKQNINSNLELPTSIDWRQKGYVSNIRNQMQCGSCWAFSGTSTLESAVAIKTGILYDLSEQQGVSCSTIKQRYTNMGCNGGMYDELWSYISDNNGICSESDYPYTSGNGDTGTCLKTCSTIAQTKVTNHIIVTPNSDSALMQALTVNTVSIAIEADTKSFQLYKSGIYNDYLGCNSNSNKNSIEQPLPNIDHAVVLVGYNSDIDQNYYILRNSWDTTWGESGYMRIAKGDSYGKYGMCGLLYMPMYPIV